MKLNFVSKIHEQVEKAEGEKPEEESTEALKEYDNVQHWFDVLFSYHEMWLVYAYMAKPVVLVIYFRCIKGYKNLSLYCLRLYLWRLIYDFIFIFTRIVIILEANFSEESHDTTQDKPVVVDPDAAIKKYKIYVLIGLAFPFVVLQPMLFFCSVRIA